jgi:transcription termination/antitermination protein NusA
VGVYLNEKSGNGKTATVVVPEDQLSLAIGRDGQNARLAAKLTGWRIDIKSLTEAASDTIYRLQQDAELAEIAEAETENIAAVSVMLAKKAEGRPLNPEDYEVMGQFVDRSKNVRLPASLKNRSLEDQHLQGTRTEIPAEATKSIFSTVVYLNMWQ